VFEYRHIFTFAFIVCEYCRIIRLYASRSTVVAVVPPKFESHCVPINDCDNLKKNKGYVAYSDMMLFTELYEIPSAV
jgi:hypothetical protein